jgi:serine protease Do
MLNQTMCFFALSLGCLSVSATDVLRLKENAAVAGKILTEKPDQVVIDIGYTVLVVPRTEIVNMNVGTAEAASESEPVKADKAKVVRVQAVSPAASDKSARRPTAEKPGLFQEGDAAAPDRSVRDLVSLLGEAVVQVRTPSGLGSGFIINDDGYLVTNFHVIESETQISVEVYHQKDGQLDRRTYKQVRIVAMNKFADLALLKIDDKEAPKFASVPLGDSDDLGVGERVFAIGSPMGLERTVTEGIVSTKTRPMQGELYLQTTTQINPGNSGGPLFNLRGEVVGITNMKIVFGEGLGFAIPVHTVKYFLNHRDAYAYDNDNPSSPYRYLEPPNRISKLIPER